MLIKCQECSHQISDRAADCPSCGCPVPRPSPNPETGYLICESCGNVGTPIELVNGRTSTEVLFWICGILPGLLYSLWRSTTLRVGCPLCGGKMIEILSPRGQYLLRQFHGQNIRSLGIASHNRGDTLMALKVATVIIIVIAIVFLFIYLASR